ncbi:hypothetical protein M9Y10_025437 [Tritrichomonas musculus]|uniref:Non-specific serine/threonine protein kinase n=1 Tax=Tritrichomonas musculus TaxID=1915356 RepID=A0ABR2H8P1_9EUKA
MNNSLDPVDCGLYFKGVLYKQSTIFKMWQKCFCELQQTELYIRKSEDADILDYRVPIASNTHIELIENPNFFTLFVSNENNNPSQQKQKNQFLFKSSNEEDIFKWYIALKSASLNINSPYSLDSFNIISVIGRGYFGKVMLVQNKETKKYYALKSIHKARLIRTRQLGTAITELNVLKRSESCPFIVELKFAFQTATKFYLGLEFVPGGDILNAFSDLNNNQSVNSIDIDQVEDSSSISYIQSEDTNSSIEIKNNSTQNSFHRYCLEDSNIRLYIAEIAIALDFLHKNKIIYRDLKPENILIGADGHIKLTDFGSAKDFMLLPNRNITTSTTFCGTPEYIAPEMIKKEKYSYEIDWWALGIFTYEMYFDKTPFVGNTPRDIYKNILEKDLKFPKNANTAIIDFIKLLLEKDPKNRANFQKLKKHPFWENLNLAKVYKKQIPSKFVPVFDGGYNLKYFDSVFTNEIPLDSSAQPVIGITSFIPGFDFCQKVVEESSDYSSDSKVNQNENNAAEITNENIKLMDETDNCIESLPPPSSFDDC